MYCAGVNDFKMALGGMKTAAFGRYKSAKKQLIPTILIVSVILS